MNTMIRTKRLLDAMNDPNRMIDGQKEPLVIIPAPQIDEATGGNASVDLRLGTWFVTLRQPRMPVIKIDAKNQELQFTKTRYVPFGKEYYLHPRCFVLATTLEWIRLPIDMGAYVIGKSSWGRRGLIIATATGVQPGFNGCLTLELSNVGEIPIEIKPGMSICQLFIHEVTEPYPANITKSQFAGTRKPIVGVVEMDEFAKKLAAIHP
jgi:dCTP deaminase